MHINLIMLAYCSSPETVESLALGLGSFDYFVVNYKIYSTSIATLLIRTEYLKNSNIDAHVSLPVLP